MRIASDDDMASDNDDRPASSIMRMASDNDFSNGHESSQMRMASGMTASEPVIEADVDIPEEVKMDNAEEERKIEEQLSLPEDEE